PNRIFRRSPPSDSLALSSRPADLNLPRCHLGVFLTADEVELGGADVAVPGEFPHLVHGLFLTPCMRKAWSYAAPCLAPHASPRLGFFFRRLESILATGAASGRPRPMAMIGPCFKDKSMIILHDAGSSRHSVEPGCTPHRRDRFERISLWVAHSASGREGFYFA